MNLTLLFYISFHVSHCWCDLSEPKMRYVSIFENRSDSLIHLLHQAFVVVWHARSWSSVIISENIRGHSSIQVALQSPILKNQPGVHSEVLQRSLNCCSGETDRNTDAQTRTDRGTNARMDRQSPPPTHRHTHYIFLCCSTVSLPH